MNVFLRAIKALLDLNRNRCTITCDEDFLFIEVLRGWLIPMETRGVWLDKSSAVIGGVSCQINVMYNPYMALLRGVQGALCIADMFGNVNVLVDDTYMSLSESAREFTLWHELGHIALKHSFNAMSARQRYKFAKKGGVSQQELDADVFSSNVVGKEVALQALVELGVSCKGKVAKQEIESRIKSLS